MSFSPKFWTCSVGSFPHIEAVSLGQRIREKLDVPIWPQLPKRDFLENMYVQFSAALPLIVLDRDGERIYFDTSGDFPLALEPFYERYLIDDLDVFGLPASYATGFYELLEALSSNTPVDTRPEIPGTWVKGQVTGPISMGLTITDQNLRASLYNEMLADVLVKNAAMNARWQIRQLKRVRKNVIIFIDEPYMASFGSAYISLSRDLVVAMLDEVFVAIHDEGALAGVHCCANTDWSVLLATKVDILNIDSYGFMNNLALYPFEIRDFLDRGGAVAWGIVPNTEAVLNINPMELAEKLIKGFELINERAERRGVKISLDELSLRSLLTTSCGLGPVTVEIADRALDILEQVGKILKSSNS